VIGGNSSKERQLDRLADKFHRTNSIRPPSEGLQATFAQSAQRMLTPRVERPKATEADVQATVERLFYGTGSSRQLRQQTSWAQDVASRRSKPLTARKGGTFGHLSTVQRLPAPTATTQYLNGNGGGNSPNPLRIVNHNLHGTGKPKMNPDHTHRGRIRNALGGFYCK
jgi:hypothetical protein